MANSNTSTLGVGFPALLGLTFIILKLCHVIGWSWWWVLCPFWAGLGIAILIALIYFILLIAGLMRLQKRR